MQVVTVVHHRINALRAGRLDVRAIHLRCFFVGLYRGVVVAGADINVGGHVNDVTRPRRKRGQLVCARERALRIV